MIRQTRRWGRYTALFIQTFAMFCCGCELKLRELGRAVGSKSCCQSARGKRPKSHLPNLAHDWMNIAVYTSSLLPARCCLQAYSKFFVRRAEDHQIRKCRLLLGETAAATERASCGRHMSDKTPQNCTYPPSLPPSVAASTALSHSPTVVEQ